MASNNLATFSPNQVSVVITQGSLSHEVSGFSSDSIVGVNRSAETFTMYTGADDSATRIYNSNTTGVITIPLQQTSNSNDVLMELYENDRATKNGLFEIMVKDLEGRSVYHSREAFISIVPDSQYSNDMSLREWTIQAHKLDYYVGGNSKFDPVDESAMTTLGAEIEARWLTSD
jgi:hypothetical protein